MLLNPAPSILSSVWTVDYPDNPSFELSYSEFNRGNNLYEFLFMKLHTFIQKCVFLLFGLQLWELIVVVESIL